MTLGRAMPQVVSRGYFTAEARNRPQVSPCEISRAQSGIGTGLGGPVRRADNLAKFM